MSCQWITLQSLFGLYNLVLFPEVWIPTLFLLEKHDGGNTNSGSDDDQYDDDDDK